MGFVDSLLAPARPDSIPADSAEGSICAPASGRVVPLEDVKDPVFAQGMLGQGLAIQPSEGVAYAPVSGTVTAVVNSKHAVAIHSDLGVDVLLHIGVDTVNLRGKGFHIYVEKGDRVRAGDPLIVFDEKLIHDSGLDDTVIVTVTNAEDMASVEPACGEAVGAGEPLLRAETAA